MAAWVPTFLVRTHHLGFFGLRLSLLLLALLMMSVACVGLGDVGGAATHTGPGGLVGLLALQALPKFWGSQGDQDGVDDEVVQRCCKAVSPAAATGLLVTAVPGFPVATPTDDRRPAHDGAAMAASQDPRQQQPPGSPGLAAAVV